MLHLGLMLVRQLESVSAIGTRERMLAAAERAGDQLVIAMNTAMLAGVCYVRGDWDRGRDLAGRALECFAASSSPVAVRWVGLLAPALIWHGAWDQAREALLGVARRIGKYAGSDEVLRGIVAELERDAESWAVQRIEGDRKLAYARASYSLKARDLSGSAFRRSTTPDDADA